MIKILPTMQSEKVVKRLEASASSGGTSGPGGGGGQRPISIRTDLKRRSKEGDLPMDKKRRRRPASSIATATATATATLKPNRRLRRPKSRKLRTGTNNAPFNSTQFLMSDHGGDTIQYLDNTLGVSKAPRSRPASERVAEAPVRRVSRARESSFSLDSDEDFYYSSPEDEEEFVSQEFIKEYNNIRTDRLVGMSKSDLIQEYLQMEQRVDSLEKRLNRHKGRAGGPDDDEEASDSSSDSDSKETAEQIRLFQKEILRLEAENEQLRSANVVLLQQKKAQSGSGDVDLDVDVDDEDDYSSCSTCSSSSSSSSQCGSSSEDEDQPSAVIDTPASPWLGQQPATSTARSVVKLRGQEVDKEDTGYESSHSGSARPKDKVANKSDDTVSSSTN